MDAPRCQLGEEHRCTGQLLCVAGELAGQNIEQFIEDRLGQQQPVALVYNALQRKLALSAGKDKPGDQDVGVEDDLQVRR